MKKLSSILSMSLAGLMALSMAACGGAASSAAPASTQTASSTAAAEEKITLRIMDSSDSTQARREVFNKEFMERHPNITVEYTMMSGDAYTTTLTTAIKSGTAPDLFAMPSGVKLDTAVSENWYQSMTPYLSKDFVNTFVDGALNEGTTTIDGEIYALPESLNIVNSLMYYNKDLLEQAGVTDVPKTWSEFTEACKKITAAGNGQYYGIIESGMTPVRCEIELRSFANIAGAKCNYYGVISLVDGKNTFASDGMVAALGLYDTLYKDGSIYPDSVNLAAPEARALFAQGAAGFLIQGSWCIPTWRSENPDFNFGVMALPTPDDGAKGGNPYIGAMPWMGISATSANPEAAALYLSELYGEDYQSLVVSDGGFVSAIKGVNEKSMTDEQMLEYYNLAMSSGTLCPDPLSINPATAAVYTEVKEVTPNLGQIFQGVISGGVSDYKAALTTFSDATQTEYERAINAVDGVTVEDFEFPNWDAMKNYTA